MATPSVNTKYGNTKAAHVVPRAYLEAWSVDGQIGVHLVKESRDVVMSVGDAGTRRHFYRRERPETGERIDDVESMLSTLEGLAAPVVQDVAGRWPFTLNDKRIIAELFAYQLLRGPRWKDTFEKRGADFVNEQRERGVHEIGGVTVPVPQAVYDRIEESFAGANQFANNTTRFLRMITGVPTIISMLGSMQWTLLEFASPVIATCDHPIVLYPRTHHALAPGAFVVTQIGLAETIEVRVPLTPTLVLLMTWYDEPGADGLHVGADRDIAMNLNALTIPHAERQWFYLPGAAKPQAASGWPPPVAPKLIPDYDHRRCEASVLRRSVHAYAQSMVGRDLHDRSVKIFSVNDLAAE